MNKIKVFLNRLNFTKKVLLVVLCVVILFAIFSAVFDGIRVHNNKEPIFTIKNVEKEPLKVTYFGLGYKVVSYPSISELEPFGSNRDAKFGTWFMRFKQNDITPKHILYDIIDKAMVEMLPCDDVIETFFEDEEYIYQFPCEKARYVLAHFKDGTEMPVAEALKNGDITIEDLDDWDIYYIKTKK